MPITPHYILSRCVGREETNGGGERTNRGGFCHQFYKFFMGNFGGWIPTFVGMEREKRGGLHPPYNTFRERSVFIHQPAAEYLRAISFFVHPHPNLLPSRAKGLTGGSLSPIL